MSFFIQANKFQAMKHIHQLQIFFNYCYFSFNTKHFTLKLGRGRVVQLLILEKSIKARETNLNFSVSQLHKLVRNG